MVSFLLTYDFTSVILKLAFLYRLRSDPDLFRFPGTIQFLLGRQGCADNDFVEVNLCPLPRYFNHNALMHLVVTAAVTFLYMAEILSMRRCARLDRYAEHRGLAREDQASQSTTESATSVV